MLARLDWLHDHNIKIYSIHGGCHDEGVERGQAYALFLEQLAWLDARCQERGITLGVETMFAMPSSSRRANLLVGLDEVDQFLRDNERVPLVVDLAHLGLWPQDSPARRLEVFHRARGRILEVHVSDNDGQRDLHTAISERAWWWPFGDVLPEAVPVVVETRLDGPGRPSLNTQIALLSRWLS
jgi:sugar phosphate isomerase/epimerase